MNTAGVVVRKTPNWLLASMLKAQEQRAIAAGPRHLLLVLLELPAEDVARRALSGAKVTSEGLGGVGGRSRRRGISPSPALVAIDAFAQGLATARGERQASASDELISLCWHPEYWLSDRDPRRRILQKLKAEGAVVPPLPVPRWEPTRLTQRVELERLELDAAVALLKERHPVGTHPQWGFNYLPKGRAVLFAEDGVDLEAIVATAAEANPRAG